MMRRAASAALQTTIAQQLQYICYNILSIILEIIPQILNFIKLLASLFRKFKPVYDDCVSGTSIILNAYINNVHI